MHTMLLRDAKENLSKVIDQALDGDPVLITRRGKPQAVVLSWTEYERLTNEVPSFGWLMSHPPQALEEIQERDTSPPRTPEF